jgi:ribose/xylose/arabinose/galactoside ABC-type transport system permease subunit
MPSPVPSRDRLRLLVPRPPADEAGGRHWSAGQLLQDETGVAAVLVLLVLAVGIAHPDFLTRSNLTSTAHNADYVGLMAAGMVFALAMREVDLSVG